MSKIEAAIHRMKIQIASGMAIEQLIHTLRADGLSKVESIQVLSAAAKFSLRQAKEVVHMSETWADVRERDEEFSDRILTELQEETRADSKVSE